MKYTNIIKNSFVFKQFKIEHKFYLIKNKIPKMLDGFIPSIQSIKIILVDYTHSF